MKDIGDKVALRNGIVMPRLGLGLYLSKEGEEVERAVLAALETGYRSFDTAEVYHNETGVGKALRAGGVPREEYFVTTKVWNANQGYASTLKAFENSRKRLGVNYIDLYLIHWPVAEKYAGTWRALEKLYREGYVRAIGTSNFQIRHLEEVMRQFEIVPMVNQVELHPLLTQIPLRSFCGENGIQIESWRPLLKGKLDYDVLSGLAKKYHKTPAQIAIRWQLQQEIVVIPKSVQAERIKENAGVFDFSLAAEDMVAIAAMNENRRLGPDPDDFQF